MFQRLKSKQKLDKHSKQEVRKLLPVVEEIESYRDQMMALTDNQLQAMTEEFRFRLRTGEVLDDILPEAYAVIRETDRRILGKEPYRVQLMGAILLHQGRVAELKTGEGKTLLGTLPAYLNALSGKGVHIVTVNEYLARRDSDEMRQVHEFLGLTVGCVFSSMSLEERQEQYKCDITYVTNSEVGFDYLRDNMVQRKEDKVQRGLVYAIIDEVDSVLIDEARTPLIISGQSSKNTLFYGTCDILAKRMVRGSLDEKTGGESGDFILDEKDKVVTLTEEGLKKAESFLKIENLASSAHLETYHGVITALRANYLMTKGQDYIVKDGEVLIVDVFTGRTMEGRRYSDGLHQAIEAKERVAIQKESHTNATITYQNFFNKYEKKCGMTGTGKIEELEFREIYSMDVVEVPTNKPVIREDLPDAVYLTEDDKWRAVCEAVESAYNRHQPVLVGVATIAKSEKLSSMLSKRGIPHAVLNAKNDALEAEIIAQAGQLGAVTVATNIAGRGTDIKLGPGVAELGGLKVIGTERHESRRIDNQLRGRSGRQGDPGESQFYLSLEDDLIKLFGRTQHLKDLSKKADSESGLIVSRRLHKFVDVAQKRVEDNLYGVRKHVFEYDGVNNDHREVVYNDRNKVLDGDEAYELLQASIQSFVRSRFDKAIIGEGSSVWDIRLLNELVLPYVPIMVFLLQDAEGKSRSEFLDFALNRVDEALQERVSRFSEAELDRTVRQVLLYSIDVNWKNHLEDLDYLKQWVGLNAYGQKDPRFEFKRLGNQLLANTRDQIHRDVTRLFFGG